MNSVESNITRITFYLHLATIYSYSLWFITAKFLNNWITIVSCLSFLISIRYIAWNTISFYQSKSFLTSYTFEFVIVYMMLTICNSRNNTSICIFTQIISRSTLGTYNSSRTSRGRSFNTVGNGYILTSSFNTINSSWIEISPRSLCISTNSTSICSYIISELYTTSISSLSFTSFFVSC